MRVGIGYDIHALKKGRPLILGGVKIPFAKGLYGYSDGDALWHAVIDAILGAMGMGDIGELFPDTDPRFRGASGEVFARRICKLLKINKLKINSIDTLIIAEAPKLANFKPAMKRNIAKGLGISPLLVNVKAKTHEGFDALGQGKAIACQAIVSLQSSHPRAGGDDNYSN